MSKDKHNYSKPMKIYKEYLQSQQTIAQCNLSNIFRYFIIMKIKLLSDKIIFLTT